MSDDTSQECETCDLVRALMAEMVGLSGEMPSPAVVSEALGALWGTVLHVYPEYAAEMSVLFASGQVNAYVQLDGEDDDEEACDPARVMPAVSGTVQ